MAFSESIVKNMQSTLDANINAPGAAQTYSDIINNRVVIAPIGVRQIGSFAFDYKGDDIADLNNEITDHLLEDNTAVHDHVGLRPKIITLNGFVSELSINNDTLNKTFTALSKIQNSLSRVSVYLGKYTPAATDAINAAITKAQSVAVQIQQSAALADQFSSFLRSNPNLTKQQQAFAQLEALIDARILFTAYTPFKVYSNMTIKSIRAIQPRTSKSMTDFSIVMKQLRFSNDISTSFYDANHTGRNASGQMPQTQNGATSGAEVVGDVIDNLISGPISVLNKL